MNYKISICFLLAFISCVSCFSRIPKFFNDPPEKGKLWAVLVAGSYGWINYRHQADICHAYQVLKNHGIPDERIIVLMVDDIAYNSENPTPGILINSRYGLDVYKGVPKDYTGKAVTPQTFMAVLRGDKTALKDIGSGKVLESGSNDHVFIFFADHGAPGLLGFPGSTLSARDLNKTIHYMYDNGKYNKMVIYIEACESGSMFKNILPRNINVFATTAANSTQSSYACYWDIDRSVFLGDTYSVSWTEDSDTTVLSKETLLQQYKKVKNETKESHVQEFGDMEIAKMPLSEFQGRKPMDPITLPRFERDSVSSRDVPIETLKRKYMQSNSVEEQSRLQKKMSKMLKNRLFLTKKVSEIVTEAVRTTMEVSVILNNRYELKDFDCYDEVREYFDEECFQLSKNPYAFGSLYVFVNMCEKKISVSRMKIAMERACNHPPIYGIV